MNVDNKQYLAAFLFSGFVGMGCKMILSADVGESEVECRILDNIPIACAISGALIFSAVKILPNIEVEEGSV